MFNFRVLLVSMLLFVFCCPFASYAEQDEAAMMATAQKHYQEAGYYYATTWLERILKNWPNTPRRQEVLLLMVKAYAATGREEKALSAVKTLQRDFPRYAEKLDPGTLEFVQGLEARKVAPYASIEPLDQPGTSAAAALPVPAPVPAAPEAAELATGAAASPSSPAPTADVEPSPAAPPVAQAPPAPAEPATAPVEAEPPPVQADAAAPPAAAAAEPPTAKDAAEPPKAVPAPAEPAAKMPQVETEVPARAEVTDSPAAAPAEPPPATVDAGAEANGAVTAPKRAEAPQDDSKAGSDGTYTLELGEYVGKSTLAGAKRLVKKAGLTPLVGPGPKRTETMLRILVGEFTDQGSAQKLQKRLAGVRASYFILKDQHGIYRVFAGSYSDHAAAVTEQKRLTARGIGSELREVTVPVPTFLLTAGRFPDEKSANDKLAELEQLGLKGKVLLPR